MSDIGEMQYVLRRAGFESEVLDRFFEGYALLDDPEDSDFLVAVALEALAQLAEALALYKWAAEHVLTSELRNREYCNHALPRTFFEVSELLAYYEKNVRDA